MEGAQVVERDGGCRGQEEQVMRNRKLRDICLRKDRSFLGFIAAEIIFSVGLTASLVHSAKS